MTVVSDACLNCRGSQVYCDGRRYVYQLSCCEACTHQATQLQLGGSQKKEITMAETTSTKDAAKSTASKPRKIRTEAERIKDLERQLAEAKAKAEQRSSKAADALKERRGKLVARRDKIDADIKALDAELEALAPRVGRGPDAGTPEG